MSAVKTNGSSGESEELHGKGRMGPVLVSDSEEDVNMQKTGGV